MKKLFFTAFALCAAFAFTACGDDESAGPTETYPMQLAAPVPEYEIVSPREVRVYWRAVEHAEAYGCVVDDRTEVRSLSCEVTVDPLGAAACTVIVRALSSDTSRYLDSEPALLRIGDIPALEGAATLGFESAELGTDGFIWGKPMATEQDDTDWQGNPIRSNLYYGSLYTEGAADVWTFFSDSGHTFDAWNGFVVSNRTDRQTAGPSNDKSVYAESGAEGSKQFAVGYYGAWTAEPYGIPVIRFGQSVKPLSVRIAMTTYVYLYFRDDVAEPVKPDYTLVVTGLDGEEQTGEVAVPLVNGGSVSEGWKTVDLTSLSDVTSLEFRVACKDEMAPLYFGLDNLIYMK